MADKNAPATMSQMLFIAVFIFKCVTAKYDEAICSPASGQYSPSGCLDAIKALSSNDSLYWYGTPYGTRCPQSKQATVNCLNLHTQPRTLAQAVFGIDNPDLSKLDRLIEVNYSSEAGSYTGCFSSYTFGKSAFSVNPISEETHEPWTMRTVPNISWQTDNSSDIYTWIMFDPGFLYCHAIYMNIQGNDISSASIVYGYSGPLNMRFLNNPYTFLIYKQTGYVNASLGNPAFFNVTQFAEKYELDGPVGFTWLIATTDAYAIGVLKNDRGLIDNCAALIENAYNDIHHQRSFLPNPLADLTVDLSIKYDSPEFSYTCGGAESFVASTSFTIDPVGMVTYKPAITRTATNRTYSLVLNKYLPQPSELNGKCYMLLMLDPDLPSSFAIYGNSSHPFLHELAYNFIQIDGVLTGVNHAVVYMGPLPPDETPHIYYFLLYEDPNCVQQLDVAAYVGANCPSLVANRCSFDVQGFVSDKSLTLAGVSWMKIEKDAYASCMHSGNKAGMNAYGRTVEYVLILSIAYSVLNRYR